MCTAVALGLSACGGCNGEERERHKHEYIRVVTEPTCTAKGYSTYTCECGSKYVTDYTDPLGHDYDGDKCLRCGWIRHDHIYTKTEVAATCTEGGYTRGVCDVCGATYTAYYTEPLGHDYDNGFCKRCDDFDAEKHEPRYEQITVEPDCENSGYTAYNCKCGDSFREDYFSPLGHDYKDGICTRCKKSRATEGLEYTLSNDGTYYICSGIGTATDADIFIPSQYNGLPVKEIGEWAFYQCYSITSVEIENGVSVIGNNAFNVCTGVKKFEIPDSVTVIEEYAFYTCTGITKIVIPDSVTYIGNNTFFQCTQLIEVIIPSGMKSIGRYAFGWCTNLSSITIPDGVNFIDSYAFFNCRSLTGIVIRESVTTIGYGAFEGCSSLTIYCEVKSKPSGWDNKWSGGCTIVWDCKIIDIDYEYIPTRKED